MRRLGRFLRRRGLGATLGLLAILLSATIGFAVVARASWQNPLASNILWCLVAVIVVCAVTCWWKWPRGEEEDGDPGILVEDSPNAEIRGNVPKEVADKGVKLRRSPGATVRTNVSEEGGDEDQVSDDP